MSRRTATRRRAFTLVELLVAGMVAFIVMGAITTSLFQSSRARNATKTRLTAFSRAGAALDIVRKDIASIMRRADLFETRLLLINETISTRGGDFDRDELLLFNTSLRPTRPNEYSGEGQEYESHFRVGEDETGIIIWQRRDAVPDEWCDAGGIATPLVTGVVGLKIEAYDGEGWYDDWDSDIDGLPWALRVTLTANGAEPGAENPYENSDYFAVLRTQIAIDRIVPPLPPPPPPEEALDDLEGDATEDGSGAAGTGGIGGGGIGGGRPGGGRGEGGRPGGRPGAGGRPGGGGRPGSGSGPPDGVGGRPGAGGTGNGSGFGSPR